MGVAEHLYKTIKDLPEPVIVELLDFAEFLRARNPNVLRQTDSEPLLSLQGGLEGATTFAGDPLAIQERMRNEWN